MKMLHSSCLCQRPPFHYTDFESHELGEDSQSGDLTSVSIERCKHCGRYWLHYLIEQPEFTASGRWWRVPIDLAVAEVLGPDDARRYIEQQSEGFVGGSYFQSTGKRATVPIKIF